MGRGIGRATFGGLLALGAAVPLVARGLEPGHGTPIPQLAAFAPLALPVWLLATLLLLGRGRPRLVLSTVMVAVLVLQLWWALPGAPATRAEKLPAHGRPVTVMTQNAQFGQANAEAIVQDVRRRRVDLLVITELTPALITRLYAAGLGDLLPNADPHPGPGAAGTGIWSRWTLVPLGQLAGLEFASPTAIVRLPGGQAVTVTAVHPRAPHPGHVPQWRRELGLIGAAARHGAGPRLIVGDFNAGRSHSGFRALLKAGFADAADARPFPASLFAPGFTWPADRRYPPLTRIDHVLLTPGSIAARSTAVVRVPGTDHRGVVASLVMRPG